MKTKGYSYNQVKEWLAKQETYTLYKPSRSKFRKPVIVPTGLDDQWEIDLFDISSIARYNNSTRYGLLAIDTFSKFVWVVPLKTKKTEEVAEAFAVIIAGGRKPKAVRSDLGREFTGGVFEALLEKENIKHFYAYSPQKAVFAERTIKTIKTKIFKYISAVQNYRYIDKLPDIVHAYNSSKHSSTGRPPDKVNTENESEVRFDMYLIRNRRHKPVKKHLYEFDVGDIVRISYTRTKFTREYAEKWSHELFKIKSRFPASVSAGSSLMFAVAWLFQLIFT